jgi:YHS domain-containing protein
MAAAVLLLAAAAPALAKPPVNASYLGSVAIEGADPVAYFTEKKAVKGAAAFKHRWNGAEWRFKNAANRDAFAADPQKFAPQFGGYCAWAVSQGYTAKGDPQHWKIVGGKLYLNYDGRVQKTWEKDVPGNIAQGDRNWPKVLDK